MRLIRQTYMIAAPPEEVWKALTDPAVIREWSGADVIFTCEAGAPYSLWDGTISGEIVEVLPVRRLVQTWKPEDWETQDSVVRFTLVPEEGTTRIDLVHENVEESDYEGTNEGWDIYYLGAIKRMLEAKNPPKSKKRVTNRKAVATKKKPSAKRSRATQHKPVKKKPARR